MSTTSTIEEVCDLVTDGTHYTPKDVGSGVPFLTVKDVSDLGLDFCNCSFITETDYQAAKAGNSAPQKGDVLFSKDGTVGKVHVVTNDKPFAVLSSLAILRPNSKRVDAYYLGHVLRSPAVLDDALKRKTGSAIRRIVLSDLKKVRVPLPLLPEQQRIVAVLDKAEELRAKRRAALAMFDEFNQAIFLEMFGDPGINGKNWPRKSLKALGKVATGGTPPSAKTGMFDGPIPFVTPGDLESEALVKRSLTAAGAAESVTVRSGATLVCCIGATIGKITMAIERCAFNQQINSVEWADEVDDLYGFHVLRFFKPTIIAWGASTTLPILKKSSFERIEIPVPPISLQREFAQRAKSVESLRKVHKNSLERMDELFIALQQRAFKGEL